MNIKLAPLLLVAGLALPSYTQASESIYADPACEFIQMHARIIHQFHRYQNTSPRLDNVSNALIQDLRQGEPGYRVYHF